TRRDLQCHRPWILSDGHGGACDPGSTAEAGVHGLHSHGPLGTPRRACRGSDLPGLRSRLVREWSCAARRWRRGGRAFSTHCGKLIAIETLVRRLERLSWTDMRTPY